METNITADRIREVMGGLSQEKFAKSITSSQSVVSKILSGGPPSLNILTEISNVYNVSIDWLLGLSPYKYLNGYSTFEEDRPTTYADVIAVLVRLMKNNSISCGRTPIEGVEGYDPYGVDAKIDHEDIVKINDHFIGDLVSSASTIVSTSPEAIDSWLNKITQDYGVEIKEWTEYEERAYVIGIKEKTPLEVLRSMGDKPNHRLPTFDLPKLENSGRVRNNGYKKV